MSNFKPTLSIIIVSYNTRGLLQRCLQSILRNDRRLEFQGKKLALSEEEKIPAEIIVVDNASSDGTQEYLKKLKVKIPRLKIIFNQKNLGFAQANNQGMEIAEGEYVLLLNSDTIIPEGAISQTLLWLANHPEVGVVTCKLLNPDRTIQATGGFFPHLLNLICWAFFLDDLPGINRLIKPYHPHAGRLEWGEKWYQKTRELDWVTGAFLLTRQAVIREVGRLDQGFFMYVEELEWCYRIKKRGWRIFFYPGAKIIHLGGGSGGSETAILGEDQGLLRFFALHRPSWQQIFLKFILRAKNLNRWLLFGIIKNDEEKKKAYWRAFQKI